MLERAYEQVERNERRLNDASPQEWDKASAYARGLANIPTSLTSQVGGSHYKNLPIQPVVYNHKNKLGFIEGCVVKYVSRWREKGGIPDLHKAKHFLEMLIELEDTNGNS